MRDAGLRRALAQDAIRVRPKRNARGLATAGVEDPGDNLLSRLRNIIGGSCLTTVFGMGTGMARNPWAPGVLSQPSGAGVHAACAARLRVGVKVNRTRVAIIESKTTLFPAAAGSARRIAEQHPLPNGERWLSRSPD